MIFSKMIAQKNYGGIQTFSSNYKNWRIIRTKDILGNNGRKCWYLFWSRRPYFLINFDFLKNTYWQIRNSRLSEHREFDRGQIRTFLQLGRRSHCMSSLWDLIFCQLDHRRSFSISSLANQWSLNPFSKSISLSRTKSSFWHHFGDFPINLDGHIQVLVVKYRSFVEHWIRTKVLRLNGAEYLRKNFLLGSSILFPCTLMMYCFIILFKG